MKRRKLPARPGIWAPRIDALLRATGWGRRKVAKELGVGNEKLRKVLEGGAVPVRVALGVKRLEVQCAEDLEALAAGAIVWRGTKRYDFRRKDGTRGTGRPADLAGLGEVGMDDRGGGAKGRVGQGNGVGFGEGPSDVGGGGTRVG